jgi:16S rRNA processing protein RimM
VNKVPENWLVVARFGRPHGIKGFIHIHSFTEPYDNLLHYKDWHAMLNKQWQPIEAIETVIHHHSIIALIKGYSDRESVARLTQADIAIQKAQLPKLAPGEYYCCDLLGLTVVTEDKVVLGVVTEVMPTGSNDVLVIKGEKIHMVPYIHGQFVKAIDIKLGMIRVDWDPQF